MKSLGDRVREGDWQALRTLEAERDALARALRRKCVLDDYGVTIENLSSNDFDRWLAIVCSNERLAEWFGEPLQDYILENLERVE